MSEDILNLARAVVWVATEREVAAAQAQLWRAAAPDMDLYHMALWNAGLEKMDFLRWERQRKRDEQTHHWAM
jgi:hypothetical protein